MERIIRRNLMHIFVGVSIAVFYKIFGAWISFYFLIAVFAIGTIVQTMFRRGYSIEHVEFILNLFETEDETENWRGLGAQTLVLGSALTILIFPKSVVIPAILVLAFADAMSAIMGSSFKSSVIVNRRTIFGSLSFAITAFFVLNFFYPKPIAAFVAMGAALIELVPFPDDNLWVPMGTALLLSIFAPLV